MSIFTIPEADILWQTKLGTDIIAGGPIVGVDIYSWTAPGSEYISNSWMWNVLLGQAYLSLNEIGILLVTFVGVGLVFGFIVMLLRANNVPWISCTITIVLISTFSRAWLNARPQLADYILTAFFAWLCLRTQYSPKWKIGVIFIGAISLALWNNLHLTGPVGAFLFAGLVFMGFRDAKMAQRILYSVSMLILGALACLLTPYGVNGMVKPLTTVSKSVGVISEWASPWTFYGESHFISIGLILVFLFVAFRLWKNSQWLDATFVTGLILVASYQNRWAPFLAVAGALWLGRSISQITISNSLLKNLSFMTLAAALVPMIVLSVASFAPGSRIDRAEYGASVVKKVPSSCKLLNSPEMGGPIILLRPDLKVSLDGRNDMYGDVTYIDQNHALLSTKPEVSKKWISENNITCVLANNKMTIQEHLLTTGDWDTKATDGIVDLLVKK